MNNENTTVILARVSSKAQEDEGYSLDAQLKLLESYCINRQLHVIKIFKIAETASKEQSRKIFHELLEYMNKNKIFHLAVEKTDRLTRNFRDAVAIDDWLEKDDRRRLHAVKENLLLHKTARSDVKFMWNIHISVAKKYTDNLREESMKGWTEKLAQGWMPAPPPPGYMNGHLMGRTIHVPDPATKHLILKVFEKYLEPGHSIQTITNEMEMLGIRTAKGRPYHKSRVQHILTNPYYIGIIRFDGKDYPGKHETFIPKELFYKVQDKMHGGRPIKYIKHNPVYKNMIHCDKCAGMVTWQLQKGRFYGQCQRRKELCKGRKFIREDTVDKEVIKMLGRLVCPSLELIEWATEEMKIKKQVTQSVVDQKTNKLLAEIARLERMDSNLYDDKISGEISVEKYTIKHKEIVLKLAAINEALDKDSSGNSDQLESKILLIQLSQKAAKIFPSRTIEQKRLIVTKLFKDIVYDGQSVSVKLTDFAQIVAQNIHKTSKLIGG